jgi:hypothetical protein
LGADGDGRGRQAGVDRRLALLDGEVAVPERDGRVEGNRSLPTTRLLLLPVTDAPNVPEPCCINVVSPARMTGMVVEKPLARLTVFCSDRTGVVPP